MENLQYAARQAVRTCIGLKQEEKFVLITDEAALRMASVVITEARNISLQSSYHIMEDYGLRDPTGKTPLQFPESLRQSLAVANTSFYLVAKTFPGEFETFRKPMIDVMSKNGKLRHAHSPGVTEDIFVRGMSVDYYALRDFTLRVNEMVRNANRIRVTTSRGTDFVADVSRYKWCIADGFPAPGKWVNLPDGETFTTPVRMDGRIFVDGVLGDYFDETYGLLDKTPLEIIVREGRIVAVSCENKDLEKEFLHYTSKDENSNRFGEFAIGTNTGLERLLGNMTHDEKFPGVHVAIGDPLGEETGAEWKSAVHCDMVMGKCNVFVDDWKLMENGCFLNF